MEVWQQAVGRMEMCIRRGLKVWALLGFGVKKQQRSPEG